jgi:NAD(P)-dependent dehydrogenase (short-subunit alcohol dehydrogenase family)
MSLKDKRVLVIGGGSGIGKAVARKALTEGATVVIASTNSEKLASTVSQLGSKASSAVLDVTREKVIEKFFSDIGKFDHIAFTAGDFPPSMFTAIVDLNLEESAKMLQVRFWGALAVAKYAAKILPPGGSYTLTDGMLAHRPTKGSLLATSITGAVEHATKAMAIELAPIRVNCVCPGLIRTEMLEGFPPERLQHFETMTQRYPIPRAGMPDEAAEAYIYSMRGGYTTGQVLYVEGGALLVG